MSKLRQPVPAAQAFVLVFSGGALAVAQHWAGRLPSVDVLLALALLEFVVQPVSYLIHELGHGVVACRLGGGPAAIMVGRGPWMRFSLGQMRINFSLLPSRGVMIRGVCRYQAASLSWRSRALVSLAGPAATLMELLGGLGLAAVLWPSAGPFGRNLIVLVLVGLVGSLVVNLSPMRINRGGNRVVVGNDGTRARLALRLHREGAATAPAQPVLPGFPVAPPTPNISSDPPAPRRGTEPLAAPAHAAVASSAPAILERRRDTERARTSVPPPPQT